MINFGRVIKSYRNKKGLTQAALAAKAEITIPYLSKLENSRKIPSIPLLKRLSKLLKLPEEILFWEAVDVSRKMNSQDRRVMEIAKHIVRRYAET